MTKLIVRPSTWLFAALSLLMVAIKLLFDHYPGDFPLRDQAAAFSWPIVGGIVQLPPIGLPPLPQVPLTPEQAEALIPDELLAQIQQYAFGVGGPGVVAPACRKQGPFTFGGQTTQYPHVNARAGG